MKSRAVGVSLPAPVGGWNARDSIADMEPKDAVVLQNYFPFTTYVELRKGYSQWSTGYGAQVETIISYSGAATNKLFGISADGKIYNATSGGAVGAADLTGLSNARWQYVNVTTAGGNFVEMCNGVDGVYTYNGTTWTDQSASITGVTAANLTNINLFKNRVWFTEKNTLKAWYLPTQSITGAANALDLSAFAPHGGYLMAMGTWTIDAGYGVDDLAVFVTSNGDVIVYRGTDPTSASTWALVGVWWLGSPVGRRCMMKWKGDLLLICQDGLLPMSGALQSSRLNPRVALTDKIQSAMSTAVTNYGSNFGWQVIPYPKQNQLVLNVPVSVGTQQQYVMNTITGAWCDFTGWSANCFELYADNLYFGSTNYIAKAWDTYSDNSAAISGQAIQAFNYFSTPGQVKRFTRIRPTFNSSSALTSGSVAAQVNVGFSTDPSTATLSTATTTAGVWDTAKWDQGTWGSGLTLSRQWQGTTGIDYAGAVNLTTSTQGINLQWLATDVVFEPGAVGV